MNEGRRLCSSLSQQSLLGKKNEAILGRQYTGEMGSYWTSIDCTLRKSGSLALCQCKHPQISARQDSISPTFQNVFLFLFLFLSFCVMTEHLRRKQLKSREERIVKLGNHRSQRFKLTNRAIYCEKKKKKHCTLPWYIYFTHHRVSPSNAFKTVNWRRTTHAFF